MVFFAAPIGASFKPPIGRLAFPGPLMKVWKMVKKRLAVFGALPFLRISSGSIRCNASSGKGEPVRRPRILFLADRNILADQAYNAFSPFPEDALQRIEPDEIRKKGKVPKNASLFFTIFQTFMSGPGNANLPIGGLNEAPIGAAKNTIQENGAP